MGFLLVSAVLVVPLGRLGDLYGRVRIYRYGFVVFTAASVALALVPWQGGAAALWLIGWRVVQGVGGAMLFANSTAIITDAFGAHQRGHGAGHQPGRRHRRFVPRTAARRAAGRVGLARGVLGERADRRLRHRLGVPLAAGDRHVAAPRVAGLAGQPDLRAGAVRAAGRDHLRDPALRRPLHRVDQPLGAVRGLRRRAAAGRVLCGRAPQRRPDVPPRTVPQPGVSRPATPPGCWPRSAAAACSSC